jgi:hypothetical protein
MSHTDFILNECHNYWSWNSKATAVATGKRSRANVLKESFTHNIKISSPNNNKNNTNKKKYSRLSTQNQNDDQPLFFGFS